ncbi:MAG: pilus assembly protein [Planctomycetota bacterium]|nr:MAG: pilus assembly protein [Planctomycetota bacterium]
MQSSLKSSKPYGSHRSGAAMVEMAVVMPVFFLVIMGIIEFGRAFMVGQLLNDAAREAARSAIITGSTNAAVMAEAQSFVNSVTSCPTADVGIAITITPAAGNPDPANNLASANKRDLCHVQVSVPFSRVSFMPGRFLAGRNLSGQAAMRHE